MSTRPVLRACLLAAALGLPAITRSADLYSQTETIRLLGGSCGDSR